MIFGIFVCKLWKPRNINYEENIRLLAFCPCKAEKNKFGLLEKQKDYVSSHYHKKEENIQVCHAKFIYILFF